MAMTGCGESLCFSTTPLISRAIWSAPPPVPAGMTNSIGLFGCQARAGSAANAAAANTIETCTTERGRPTALSRPIGALLSGSLSTVLTPKEKCQAYLSHLRRRAQDEGRNLPAARGWRPADCALRLAPFVASGISRLGTFPSESAPSTENQRGEHQWGGSVLSDDLSLLCKSRWCSRRLRLPRSRPAPGSRTSQSSSSSPQAPAAEPTRWPG